MGMSGSALAPDGALYATVDVGTPGDHTTQVVAIDPSAGKVRTQTKLDAPAGAATGVAVSGGSVWVVAMAFTSTGRSCRVVRMDATSLQVQASIPLQVCPSASPAIAANDGGIWVHQPVGGAKGPGELWRIDPSTNQVGSKIAVPNNPNNDLTQAGMLLIGGSLRASDTAVFWSDGPDLYRVRPPWSTVEDLHAARGGLFVAGDAAVVETGPGRANVYEGGAPQAPLVIEGRLVGANATQLYVSRPGPDGSDQLWSEPLSGGTPTLSAEVPSGKPAPWNESAYDARTPLWFTTSAVLTVVPQPAPGGAMGLYLVVAPRR
jgi:hypothetical protein